MGNLGWMEIGFILVFALIVFGPRKLPELGKSLGQAIQQFKRASDDFKRTWEEEVDLEKDRNLRPETSGGKSIEAPKVTEAANTVPAEEPNKTENWL